MVRTGKSDGWQEHGSGVYSIRIRPLAENELNASNDAIKLFCLDSDKTGVVSPQDFIYAVAILVEAGHGILISLLAVGLVVCSLNLENNRKYSSILRL
jgi:hypothetical protein